MKSPKAVPSELWQNFSFVRDKPVLSFAVNFNT